MFLVVVIVMKDNLREIVFMEKVNTLGPIREGSKVYGIMVNYMKQEQNFIIL